MAEDAFAIEPVETPAPLQAEQIAEDRDIARAEALFREGFDTAALNLFPHGGMGRDAPDPRMTFGGVGQSEVDVIRSGMVSDAERPGVKPESSTAEDSAMHRAAEAVNAMYLNMSNYHVAWGVLQGLRRDVQQLLRGT